MQDLFRQQYSKIGNARAQLFHTWRSFHFNKNTKTIDAYVMCIRQVAALVGYGEPDILDVFKTHMPYKIALGIIPHREYKTSGRDGEENINKRKDRLLARQSSSTPFMSVGDSYNKGVSYNTQDGLEDKIDKLTSMMGKLVARDSKVNRPYQPQLCQSK